MQQLVDVASPPLTFLLLLAVGLDLTPGDFRRLRERPGMVAAGVLLPPLLLPPLAVGLIRLFAPSPVIAAGLAFVLLITLLLLVMASEPGNGEIGWWSAFAVTVAFVVTALALGALAARALGGSPADRFTFAAEFSTRNVAVALAIAMALGAQRGFTWFGAIYLTVEIPLLVLAALLHRSTHREKPAR